MGLVHGSSMDTGHPVDEIPVEEDRETKIEEPAAPDNGSVGATGSNAKANKASKSQRRSTTTKAATKKAVSPDKPSGVRKPSTRKPKTTSAEGTAESTPAKRTPKPPATRFKDATSSSKDTPAIVEEAKPETGSAFVEEDGADSVLSELGSTPEPPSFCGSEVVDEKVLSISKPPAAQAAAEDAAFPTPIPNAELSVPSLPETQIDALSSPLDTNAFPTPPSTTDKATRIISLSVKSPAVTQILAQPPSPTSLAPSAFRRMRQPTKKAQLAQDEASTLVRKIARKRLPVENEGAPPRKRQAKKKELEGEVSVETPINPPATKPASCIKSAKNKDSEVAAYKPVARKPRVPRPKEASPVVQQLPSPPVSDLDLSTINPQLLQLSRTLTYREPLDSKPLPVGKPEVWAPGRQELCETLIYFRSHNSGCHSKEGCIYGFMFDGTGGAREYMDEDVVIARMGGSMEENDTGTGKGKGKGVMYQAADHDINKPQPQAMFNNMAFNNPLVIVCGSKNEGIPTRMPHRYCVLAWYIVTHIWTEMIRDGKKRPVKTIRYRFERLNLSTGPWFRSNASREHNENGNLAIAVQECSACGKSCPQIYLIGWVCTNWECPKLWKLSNGQDAPYGHLDYHPAFLLHRTPREREEPPFSLNPGIPKIGQYFGDNLTEVNTRGIVCPDCGRCNSRYLYKGWRCDTPGCTWKLTPEPNIMMPKSLSVTPLDLTSDGPGLIRSMTKPAVQTQVKYFSNYKIIKYTITGIDGSVIVAKANRRVTSEPGGPDDMFRDMQTAKCGLERRMMRGGADDEPTSAGGGSEDTKRSSKDCPETMDDALADPDEDEYDDEHITGEVGTRMRAFGANFGMPYKFIASGDSWPFEDAPVAVRSARARLNWAQRTMVNELSGYKDFNEELVFAYLESQKINYHDDGEEGLGPRIATLSLGAPATMRLRVKGKYFSQKSKSGIFTDEKPLPKAILESSTKTKKAKKGNAEPKPSRDTYEDRVAAWEELQQLKQAGEKAAFRQRSKELCKELELKKKAADDLISFYLTHGDVVMMVGENIQKYLEHEVEPHGNLRFALTCRTVLPHHLKPEEMPKYEVHPDTEIYDGAAIREERDGEAVEW